MDNKTSQDQPQQTSRRGFIEKVGYAAPAVLTLAAVPAMASTGSSGNSGPPVDEPPPT